MQPRVSGALRQQGISYIATGKNSIDLPQAMHLLRRDFGVERLAVLGGDTSTAVF